MRALRPRSRLSQRSGTSTKLFTCVSQPPRLTSTKRTPCWTSRRAKAALSEGIVAVSFARRRRFRGQVKGLEVLAFHEGQRIVVQVAVGTHVLLVVGFVERLIKVTRQSSLRLKVFSVTASRRSLF